MEKKAWCGRSEWQIALAKSVKLTRLGNWKQNTIPSGYYNVHSCVILTFKKTNGAIQMCSPATFPNSDKKHAKTPAFIENSLFAGNSLNHFRPQRQKKDIVNTKHTQGCIKSLRIAKRSKLPMFLHLSLFTHSREIQVSPLLNTERKKAQWHGVTVLQSVELAEWRRSFALQFSTKWTRSHGKTPQVTTVYLNRSGLLLIWKVQKALSLTVSIAFHTAK